MVPTTTDRPDILRTRLGLPLRVSLDRFFVDPTKLHDTVREVKANARSYSTGQPVVASRLDVPRGAFYLIDGHHRLVEAIERGTPGSLEVVLHPHLPRIERSGGAWKDAVDRKVNAVETLRRTGAFPAETWWHLTHRARFRLDPTYSPQDNALSIEDRSGRPGLYIASRLEPWVNGYGYWRPFAVEIEVHPSLWLQKGVSGRWAGERFVPADLFSFLRVRRVIPLDAYAREVYRDYGWMESATQRAFDTGLPIADRPTRAFGGGYRYSGPDVREMARTEVDRIRAQVREGARIKREGR